MATNIPLTGNFNVTCEYGRKNNNRLKWAAGHHTGIDLTGQDQIYGTCDGIVVRIGRNDKSYGNFIVVKDSQNHFHWFCHLASISCNVNDKISRTSKIGIMGATGNVTGKHLHYEIRDSSNLYGHNINPAEYMGIPNVVGNYNSSNYQIGNSSSTVSSTPVLKTLARNTHLRDKPTTIGSSATLYVANTTVYILQAGIAQVNGFTWDKVRIRVNGKEGYMINQNYK